MQRSTETLRALSGEPCSHRCESQVSRVIFSTAREGTEMHLRIRQAWEQRNELAARRGRRIVTEHNLVV